MSKNIGLKHTLDIFLSFIIFVAKKFHQERCFDIANSLSYTSLLSLVPLMAVVFASLSSFPGFQDIMYELEKFIFSNLIPTSSELIRQYLMSFVGKAASLTLVGILSLLLIALLLMWKVDQVLNQIWAVNKKRNYLRTFLIYWAILTLGPVLIGFSLMATSYLTSLPIITNTAQSIGLNEYLLQTVAVFFTFIAFFLTYLIVPNTRVNIKHAVIGGIVATLLFELSKQGFAFYISSNKTYQNIYGTLSTIPIFLIWIYISWLVILIGAITSRSLDLFDFNRTYFKRQNNFVCASYILFYMWLENKKGKGITENFLLSKPQIGKGKELFYVIKQLEKALWIHRGEDDFWYFSRDISSLTLKDLYNDLPFELPKTADAHLLKTLILPIYESNIYHLDTNMKSYFINSQKELC